MDTPVLHSGGHVHDKHHTSMWLLYDCRLWELPPKQVHCSSVSKGLPWNPCPIRQPWATTKYFEHLHQDKATKAAKTEEHQCLQFRQDHQTTIDPRKWHSQYTKCRTCKRGIVEYVGEHFLKNIAPTLHEHQVLYVAGSFSGNLVDTAWFVDGKTGTPQPDPAFASNAEETDTRIWLHATKASHQRILVHQRLPHWLTNGLLTGEGHHSSSQPTGWRSSAWEIIDNDPELASVRRDALPKVLQCLYACTGCDYVSFFSGIGKTTFNKIFFKHASFICGENGTLADPGEQGFLAFTRLIGTTYFKWFWYPTTSYTFPQIQGTNTLGTAPELVGWYKADNLVQNQVWEPPDSLYWGFAATLEESHLGLQDVGAGRQKPHDNPICTTLRLEYKGTARGRWKLCGTPKKTCKLSRKELWHC